MLRSTRPIKVADAPSAEGQCPVKLSLLKADLLGRGAANAQPRDASPVPRRRVDLSQHKVVLGQHTARDAELELSDSPPAAGSGVRPTAGLGSVREIAYAKSVPFSRGPAAAASPAAEPAPDRSNEQATHSASLARVVETWPSLSPSCRAAILAMVEAVAAGLDAT